MIYQWPLFLLLYSPLTLISLQTEESSSTAFCLALLTTRRSSSLSDSEEPIKNL
jgi:hypothetical protein